jgi:TetR/AcrR family transcriptional regulator, fatty acid metabolism regulator protein
MKMKKHEKSPAAENKETAPDSSRFHIPPGGVKIMDAMKLLLHEKNFDSITTAEISRTAGVNEALIYRYFKDKRGLLHKILAEYVLVHHLQTKKDMDSVQGAFNKLKSFMKSTISFHRRNRVFSKILLLEVRNNPGFFDSHAYTLVRKYARLIDEIIAEGIKNREIRDDIPISTMKDAVLGGVEHACLKVVIFGRDLDEDALVGNLAEILAHGFADRGRMGSGN